MVSVGNRAPTIGIKLNNGTKNVNALSNIKNDNPTIMPKNRLRPNPPLRALLKTNGMAKININMVAKGFTSLDQ